MGQKLHRQIRPEQEDLIAGLTERYAAQKIRFDTSFNGSIPIQACGRIGRRFFYFRYRGDSASLTIGAADHRGSASRARESRRRALRTLRRGQGGDSLYGFLIQRDLRRDDSMDRHPSRPVWYAVINDVTGDPYNGCLEQEEAAELFVELMDRLQLVLARKTWNRSFAALRRGSYTPPMPEHRIVIRKVSKARR